MTLAELKAWLDGFEAAIDGAPTPDQWQRIKAKLDATAAPVLSRTPPWPVYSGGGAPCARSSS